MRRPMKQKEGVAELATNPLLDLLRDRRGNTLALVAAAIFPLTAVIGSGIDIGRGYMAKQRMQSACDAAALAGRRVLVNDYLSELDTDPVRVEAIKFFRFNFPEGLYGSSAFTPKVSKPAAGTIRVSAATQIPLSVMRIFSLDPMNISVDCEASQNFVNTDIVLVLDVTGSMDDKVSGTRKIEALREAVLSLYDELRPVQTKLEAAGMRLRYGIVPYSSSVNVGRLIYSQNSTYIADAAAYQSRTNPQALSYSNRNSCQNNGGTWEGGICTRWSYQQVTYNVSGFKTGADTIIPSLLGSATSRWNGCIEERQTDASITGSSNYSIPEGALDLNIELVPSVGQETWIPHWPDVIYPRSTTPASSGTRMTSNDAAYWACPAEAKRLTGWSRSDLDDYVEDLQPIGGTYHDIGMIWGARFISSAGIFWDSVDTYKSMPVAKHIIFMTDGQLAPNDNTYTSYGLESLDRRITGTGALNTQAERHNQRFKMVCNRAKQMNVSIWVVAFDTTASSALTECASSSSQVSVSSNRAQLIAKFVEIGKNIGALRLSQ